MWLTILSDQLPIVALVSHYLTNKLIGGGPLPERHIPKDAPFAPRTEILSAVCGISPDFSKLFPTGGQVTYALLTRSPLSLYAPKGSQAPFDLHALGTPPAFILSQDQTLNTS